MNLQWNWGAEIREKGDDGFNNASILTFNSHIINSFIRELFQNSNDAKAPKEKKVVIRIEYKTIQKSQIPQFSGFTEIVDAIKKTHPNQKKFYSKLDEILKKEEIPFLIYSDHKTTGLSGSEDDSYSSFSACVLSEGISVKENTTSGGSYGIGKNAIFGVSLLRTVFYSSLNTDGISIFQGVAKIASYKMNGKNHAGRIYLGNGDKQLSVRENSLIPEVFRRDEPGLSQFVMGVELDSMWHLNFAKAILRNYWMLLLEDGLEVELLKNGEGILLLNKKNTGQLLEELFKDDKEEYNLEPYGNPYLFYKAFTQGVKIDFDIPFIGQCSFYYLDSEEGENNIAYLRNGMVILSKIEKRLVGANITGVFRCLNDKGNEILKKMEPPKHDSFEPQMLEENHETLKKTHGEKILKEIKTNIRSVIRSLIDKYKEEIETPAFLTELFEDLQKSFANSNKGERKNESTETETIYRKAVAEEIQVSLLSEAENEYVSSSQGATSGVGSGSLQGQGPSGQKKSKKKGGKGTSGGSSKKGKASKHIVRSRIFHFDEKKDGRNIYKSIIHSDSDLGTVELSLAQYADSGEEIAFQLHRVSDANGNKIKFNEIKDAEGMVSEYKIVLNTKKGKNEFFLEITDNQKSAFVINQ